MQDFKKYTYTFLILSFISTLLFCIFIIIQGIILDPLQIFMHNKFDSTKFDSNMRLQARGMIKNCTFDSVILGTSMLENTSSREASQLLHKRFINISMSGSSFYERSLVLDYIFSQKNIAGVIYSLDSSSYLQQKMERSTYKLDQWYFLYDDNFFNDFKIYFSKKYLKYIRKNNTHIVDMDRPCAWMEICRDYFGGIEHMVKNLAENLDSKNYRFISGNSINHISYINKYIVKHIKNHPETTFYMIFPPYFKYLFARYKQKNQPAYDIHKDVIRYMATMSAQYTNLKVFGFENEPFTYNISLYRDLYHYHESINSLMLHRMANNENLLTPDNVESYLAECERQATQFDMAAFEQQFREARAALHKQ
ncbi:MAG: hypothetical protein ACI33N_06350 [Desulfovibrionaceae bacterium]